MILADLWRSFLRSDVLFWRRLRRLRALNRALVRTNRELLAAQGEWAKEREARFGGDYWFQRWRLLNERPAYVVHSVELARARTEIVRLQCEVASLRRELSERTPLAGESAGRAELAGRAPLGREWVGFRPSRRLTAD